MVGELSVPDAITPADWTHQVDMPALLDCTIPDTPGVSLIYSNDLIDEFEGTFPMQAGEDFIWQCILPPDAMPEASSRFAMSGSIPSSVTLNGMGPFTTEDGSPGLSIYTGANATPSLVTTETATSVASDGSSATFPLPSSLAPGAYVFVTDTATSLGQYSPNSFNVFAVASEQSVSGEPFGIAVAGQSFQWEDRDNCDRTQAAATAIPPSLSFRNTPQMRFWLA